MATAELLAQGLIDARPALIAVQAETVSPLATAFHRGADGLPDQAAPAATTLAEGIAIPRPPRARRAPARSWQRCGSRAAPSSR